MTGEPIYYMMLEVGYRKFYPKKKKQLPYTVSKQWCVSKYDDPQDIMVYATHSMTSLKQRLFAKTYKGQHQIKINKVLSKKEVGQTAID
tara:strand:- start:3873 stop:4139 length:267 start_codon:yes stop_codon:yes gene_type:complete